MKKLPTEFADILNPKYRHLCQEKVKLSKADQELRRVFTPGQDITPSINLPDGLLPDVCQGIAQYLSKEVGGLFPRIDRKISPYLDESGDFSGDMGQFTRSMFMDAYSPRGLKSPGGHIPRGAADAIVAAFQKLDPLQLVSSESMWHFCRNVTGYDLQPRETTWCQISEYEHGDYFSVHNDLILETSPHPKTGDEIKHIQYFTDLHLTFLTPHAMFQGFMYQKGRHFNGFFNTAVNGSLSLYRLPFWHQVTPLDVADPKQRAKARRWLLMTGFRCTLSECQRIEREGRKDWIVKEVTHLAKQSIAQQGE